MSLAAAKDAESGGGGFGEGHNLLKLEFKQLEEMNAGPANIIGRGIAFPAHQDSICSIDRLTLPHYYMLIGNATE